jgi:hypothetical protein
MPKTAPTSRQQPARPRAARTDVISVRLDPQLRYAAELAAAHTGTSLSKLIELAVTRLVQLTTVVPGKSPLRDKSAFSVAVEVWEPHAADRLARLASRFPDLMTLAERRIWREIRETDSLWRTKGERSDINDLDKEAVRRLWNEICSRAGLSATGN